MSADKEVTQPAMWAAASDEDQTSCAARDRRTSHAFPVGSTVLVQYSDARLYLATVEEAQEATDEENPRRYCVRIQGKETYVAAESAIFPESVLAVCEMCVQCRRSERHSPSEPICCKTCGNSIVRRKGYYGDAVYPSLANAASLKAKNARFENGDDEQHRLQAKRKDMDIQGCRTQLLSSSHQMSTQSPAVPRNHSTALTPQHSRDYYARSLPPPLAGASSSSGRTLAGLRTGHAEEKEGPGGDWSSNRYRHMDSSRSALRPPPTVATSGSPRNSAYYGPGDRRAALKRDRSDFAYHRPREVKRARHAAPIGLVGGRRVSPVNKPQEKRPNYCIPVPTGNSNATSNEIANAAALLRPRRSSRGPFRPAGSGKPTHQMLHISNEQRNKLTSHVQKVNEEDTRHRGNNTKSFLEEGQSSERKQPPVRLYGSHQQRIYKEKPVRSSGSSEPSLTHSRQTSRSAFRRTSTANPKPIEFLHPPTGYRNLQGELDMTIHPPVKNTLVYPLPRILARDPDSVPVTFVDGAVESGKRGSSTERSSTSPDFSDRNQSSQATVTVIRPKPIYRRPKGNSHASSHSSQNCAVSSESTRVQRFTSSDFVQAARRPSVSPTPTTSCSSSVNDPDSRGSSPDLLVGAVLRSSSTGSVRGNSRAERTSNLDLQCLSASTEVNSEAMSHYRQKKVVDSERQTVDDLRNLATGNGGFPNPTPGLPVQRSRSPSAAESFPSPAAFGRRGAFALPGDGSARRRTIGFRPRLPASAPPARSPLEAPSHARTSRPPGPVTADRTALQAGPISASNQQMNTVPKGMARSASSHGYQPPVVHHQGSRHAVRTGRRYADSDTRPREMNRGAPRSQANPYARPQVPRYPGHPLPAPTMPHPDLAERFPAENTFMCRPRVSAADLVRMSRGTNSVLPHPPSSPRVIADRILRDMRQETGSTKVTQLVSGCQLSDSQWPMSRPLAKPGLDRRPRTLNSLRRGNHDRLCFLAHPRTNYLVANWHENELVEAFDLSYEITMRVMLENP